MHGDAIIVSEAIALGTDVLVTGDVRSIDHYEVNDTIRKTLGRNSSFVVTLDNALMRAYPGGELGEELLVMAMATIATPSCHEWSVQSAYDGLTRLRDALKGANMPDTSARLLTRWEQCPNLEAMLRQAMGMCDQSQTLQLERARTSWHRQAKEVSLQPQAEVPPEGQGLAQ